MLSTTNPAPQIAAVRTPGMAAYTAPASIASSTAPVLPSTVATGSMQNITFTPIPAMFGSHVPNQYAGYPASQQQSNSAVTSGLMATPSLPGFPQPMVLSSFPVQGAGASFEATEQQQALSGAANQQQTNGDLQVSLSGQGISEQRSSGSVSSNNSELEVQHTESIGNPADLKGRLRQQIEFYFSRENLSRDQYLASLMDAEKYVKLADLMSFPRVKKLTDDINALADALRDTDLLQLDQNEMKVRSAIPNEADTVSNQRCTVAMREVPMDTTQEAIEELFKHENCPATPVSITNTNLGVWYFTFKEESEALVALNYLRTDIGTFKGMPICVRIKSAPAPANPTSSANVSMKSRRRPDASQSGEPSPNLPTAVSPATGGLVQPVLGANSSNQPSAALVSISPALPTPPPSVSSGTSSSLGPNVASQLANTTQSSTSTTPTPVNATPVAPAQHLFATYPAWPGGHFVAGAGHFYAGLFPGAQPNTSSAQSTQNTQASAFGHIYAVPQSFQQPGASHLPPQLMLALHQQQIYQQQQHQQQQQQQQLHSSNQSNTPGATPTQSTAPWSPSSQPTTTTVTTSSTESNDSGQIQSSSQAPRMFAPTQAGSHRPQLLHTQVYPQHIGYNFQSAAVAVMQALQVASQGSVPQQQHQQQPQIGQQGNYPVQPQVQQAGRANTAVVSAANRFGHQQSGQFQQQSGQQSGGRQGPQANRFNRQYIVQNQNQQNENYYDQSGPTRHPPPFSDISHQRIQNNEGDQQHGSHGRNRGHNQDGVDEENLSGNAMLGRQSTHVRNNVSGSSISPGKSSGYSSNSGSSPSGAMVGGIGTGGAMGGKPPRERGSGRYMGRGNRGGRIPTSQGERGQRQYGTSDSGHPDGQHHPRGQGSTRGRVAGGNGSERKSAVGERGGVSTDLDRDINSPSALSSQGSTTGRGSHQQAFTLDPGAFPVLEASTAQTVAVTQQSNVVFGQSVVSTAASVLAATRPQSSSPVPNAPSQIPLHASSFQAACSEVAAINQAAEYSATGSIETGGPEATNEQQHQTGLISSSSSSHATPVPEVVSTSNNGSTGSQIFAHSAAPPSYAAMLRGKEQPGAVTGNSSGSSSQVSSVNNSSSPNFNLSEQANVSPSHVPPVPASSSPSPSPSNVASVSAAQQQQYQHFVEAAQQQNFGGQRRVSSRGAYHGNAGSTRRSHHQQQQQVNYTGRQSAESPYGSS